jgi:phenylalanyl-tRNA synthetase beta chain
LGWELQSIFSNISPSVIKYSQLTSIKEKIENTNILELLQNSSVSSKKVKVETDGVDTYILIDIPNVDVKQSDLYTRLLMYDLGLNPKLNWVDFSNIFMFLTGQPIHFFDADKVKGDIVVRNAKKGEKFVDLLGQEHSLTSEDIVIADDEKILALAGIIGGQNSAVDKNTKNILVEIANFDSIRLRKTALRLGLRTDAELRFEKNINPLWSLYVLLLFLDELKLFKKTL